MGPKGFNCEPHLLAKGIRIPIMTFKVLCILSHKEADKEHVEAGFLKFHVLILTLLPSQVPKVPTIQMKVGKKCSRE